MTPSSTASRCSPSPACSFTTCLHTFTQQDVELDKLFMDVCVYNARIMGPQHVENVVELACRTALAYRGVAHVTMPVDMQSQPVDSDIKSKRNVPNHVSDVMARSSQMPSERAAREAIDILNAGKKIAILAGRGALGAGDVLTKVAERLAAPIIKPLARQGRRCRTTAPIASAASACSAPSRRRKRWKNCDTLLIAGSSFPYIEFYPKPGKAKAVQIEIDPKRIGLRYPVEAGLVGDVRARSGSAAAQARAPQGPLLPGDGTEGHGGVEQADGSSAARAKTNR